MFSYINHIRRRLRIPKAIILMLASVLCSGMVNAAQADEVTYKVEAAFLYNFFNYITWPGYHGPEDLKEATICVNANDPLLPYLEYIQIKRTQERTLTIRRLETDASIIGCQMFFLRDIKSDELDKLRVIASQNGILLVSTQPNFMGNGGMIGLTPEGERLSIDIDNSQLKQANFQVSSRLLDLAHKVK